MAYYYDFIYKDEVDDADFKPLTRDDENFCSRESLEEYAWDNRKWDEEEQCFYIPAIEDYASSFDELLGLFHEASPSDYEKDNEEEGKDWDRWLNSYYNETRL